MGIEDVPWIHLAHQGSTVGSCEDGNELQGFIKGG